MPALPSLPRSAEAYGREHRAELEAALAAVRRQWSRMTTDFDLSWATVSPELVGIVTLAQARVAEQAQVYVPAVLEETGQTRAVDPVAKVSTAPLLGVAGDGRPVDSLLYNAVTDAKEQVGRGVFPSMALRDSGQWLTLAVGTVLADTARASEALAIGVRPVGGYVRMLQPPSCSRCVVLAGKWYRKNTGFQRHPGCDCQHIPASESLGQDLAVNPARYFESLSEAEQARVFTRAGAEAIRNGADINQVVNARRGMHTAQINTTRGWVPRGRLAPVQIGGRDVFITTEGTTRRGRAFQVLAPRGTTERAGEFATRLTSRGSELRQVTRTVARRPRLMPETIQAIATDRADYLRLLAANGYL